MMYNIYLRDSPKLDYTRFAPRDITVMDTVYPARCNNHQYHQCNIYLRDSPKLDSTRFAPRDITQLHRLHRDHSSRYPGRTNGRDAHCQDFHFFIASQSSRSVVAVIGRDAHCQESPFFIASSSSRSVVAMARSRCSLSQFFTLSSCIIFDRSIWSTWKP
ncbi:hypothetical protein ACOSQ2_019766 [Xanthoceras sorbifolium]